MKSPNQPRGILHKKEAERNYQLFLYSPSEELSSFIEHYWIVEWDLTGKPPFVTETLPHPSVHIVFEKEKTRIYGVMKHKFSFSLHGKGRVFGMKFRPGAFYPFYKQPMSTLLDRTIPLRPLFEVDVDSLEKEVLLLDSHEEIIQLAEGFLCKPLPEIDERVVQIQSMLQWIQEYREITSVEAVAEKFFVSKRSLQRLFQMYVGVSPKWVIQRYRLHEVAERMAKGDVVDWTSMAIEIGYYDQSHFIRDFKSMIGKTPQEYMEKTK